MILVTGSTGFIGRAVTQALDQAGLFWTPYEGRINDPQSLRAQLDGVQTVIHLAGSEWRGRNRLLQHIDIEGTERLLEEARRAEIERIIFLSRLGAESQSLHPLLRAKGDIERIIAKSTLPYTIIRSAGAYGEGDRYFEMMLSLTIWGLPFSWLPGGGHMRFQPIWVADLARCIVATIRRDDLLGETVEVAGAERISYKNLIQLMLDTTGYLRLPMPYPMVLMRPISTILFRWWAWPPITNYWIDRFFVPEVTRFDAVYHYFGFHPSRVVDNLSFLRRSGMRWRLFNR